MENFWERWLRKCFHSYDAFTVGEVFNEKEDEIKDFIGENGYFSSMFDFEETCYGKSEDGWYASKPYLTPEEIQEVYFPYAEKDWGYRHDLQHY